VFHICSSLKIILWSQYSDSVNAWYPQVSKCEDTHSINSSKTLYSNRFNCSFALLSLSKFLRLTFRYRMLGRFHRNFLKLIPLCDNLSFRFSVLSIDLFAQVTVGYSIKGVTVFIIVWSVIIFINSSRRYRHVLDYLFNSAMSKYWIWRFINIVYYYYYFVASLGHLSDAMKQ